MGLSYSISIKLDAEYHENIIQKILQTGQKKGFIYYDTILDQYNDNPSIILPQEAAPKLIQAEKLSLELGPHISTILNADESASIWFFKNEDNTISINISAFGCPQKKGYYIDFAYYIRMFLDLCEDFAILALKTDVF